MSVIKSSDKLVKAIEERLSTTTDNYDAAKYELEKIDAEQKVFNAFAPKTTDVRVTLMDYSLELKKTVRPDFTVPPAWREEFYRRLQAKGVTIDHTQYEQAGSEIDRLLGNTVARLAFGDSTAKRRSVTDDNQLMHALQVLKQSASQKDLFIIAQREQATTASASARR